MRSRSGPSRSRLLIPQQPYRAIGGIHLRAGCERVRLLENHIVGGAGNGITLGGDLDPAPPPPEPMPVRAASTPSGRPPRASEQPVAVNVDASGQFLALVQDEAGAPQADIDVYLEASTADASTATDRSDARRSRQRQGRARPLPARRGAEVPHRARGRDARPGRAGQRDHDRAARGRPRQGAGLPARDHHRGQRRLDDGPVGHRLRAARRRGRWPAPTVTLPTNDAKASLLAFVDAALLNFALTPLLRAHRIRCATW